MFKVHGLISLIAAGLLLACSAGDSQGDATSAETVSTQSEQLKSLPRLPSPNLAVPEGNRLAFYYDAIGVQIYTCQALPTGYAWTFLAPEASLFDRRGHLVIKHFAGPTWESVDDGSQVVAKKLTDFTEHANAIPELLLQATTHAGKGRMQDVSYIQRLDTVGGLAPSSGCDAEHVDATSRVGYTATYFFYRTDSDCR